MLGKLKSNKSKAIIVILLIVIIFVLTARPQSAEKQYAIRIEVGKANQTVFDSTHILTCAVMDYVTNAQKDWFYIVGYENNRYASGQGFASYELDDFANLEFTIRFERTTGLDGIIVHPMNLIGYSWNELTDESGTLEWTGTITPEVGWEINVFLIPSG